MMRRPFIVFAVNSTKLTTLIENLHEFNQKANDPFNVFGIDLIAVVEHGIIIDLKGGRTGIQMVRNAQLAKGLQVVDYPPVAFLATWLRAIPPKYAWGGTAGLQYLRSAVQRGDDI